MIANFYFYQYYLPFYTLIYALSLCKYPFTFRIFDQTITELWFFEKFYRKCLFYIKWYSWNVPYLHVRMFSCTYTFYFSVNDICKNKAYVNHKKSDLENLCAKFLNKYPMINVYSLQLQFSFTNLGKIQLVKPFLHLRVWCVILQLQCYKYEALSMIF